MALPEWGAEQIGPGFTAYQLVRGELSADDDRRWGHAAPAGRVYVVRGVTGFWL